MERVVAANLRLLQGLKKKIDEVVELERRLKERERSSANQSSVNLDNDEIRAVPVSVHRCLGKERVTNSPNRSTPPLHQFLHKPHKSSSQLSHPQHRERSQSRHTQDMPLRTTKEMMIEYRWFGQKRWKPS